MSSQFEKSYRVAANGILDHKFWNGVFQNLDQRLVNIENKKASFEATEKQLLDLGLKRINETIQPAAEKIQLMSELGFMVASSEELLQPMDGNPLSIMLIKGLQADLFTPSPFVAMIRRSTPHHYAIGRLLHYDRETAQLYLYIVSVQGDGDPHDDWDVAALAGSVMAMWDALVETRTLRDAVAQDKNIVSQNLDETRTEKKAAQKARICADASLADFKNRYLGPLKILPQNASIGTLALDISQNPNVMKQMTEMGWMSTATISYSKQEIDNILIDLEKRTRIPVGLEGFIEDTLPPPGWLAANGNLHNISAYPDLFAWCGTRWGGDGIKTFAVPDRRGLFIRAWDKDRGLDPDRVLGSQQGDAIRNIIGTIKVAGSSGGMDNAKGAFWTSKSSTYLREAGRDDSSGTAYFDASRVVPTAEENRPLNVALLPIIKY